MNCPICHTVFQEKDRLVANSMETFIFKGAETPDSVNPLRVSEGELLASRKDHKKTEMASTFITFANNEIDDKYFNIKHVECAIPIPVGTHKIFSTNPIIKHSIRWSRKVK